MGGKLIYNEDNSFSYKDNSAFGDEIIGCRCKIVDNKLIDEKQASLHEDIIKKSGYEPGNEVYVIDWRSGAGGCIELGWIVVFDVDDLVSEVFKHDIVEEIIKSDPKITRFLRILDEKGIRYSEDWVRID